MWVWLLIAVYVIKGLAISQVMKYFNNIVKLFMTGASIVLAGVLTWLVFDFQWTLFYGLGLSIVTVSVYIYNSESK